MAPLDTKIDSDSIKSSAASTADDKQTSLSTTSDGHSDGEIPRDSSKRPEVNDEEKSPQPASGPPNPKDLPPWHPMNNPDGGRKAWLCVTGSFCCMFVSFGWISSIGVFQAYYQHHQLAAYNPSTIAWIPSLEAFMMFAGGPFIGKIFDSYGVQPLLLVGSFFHVFGLMMTSLCTEYYQFILAQGICSPLGASMIFYPGMSTIPTWFFKRRAFAFGIMAAGSSIGGIILPIMIQRLLPEVGFGWAMRICAFLILFLLIIANLTVASRNQPVKKPLVLYEFIAPLKELPYLVTTIACFLFFLGMFLPFTYMIVQAEVDGMSTYLAGYLIAILNAASFFGRVVPGYIADKVGRYNVIVLMCAFCAVIDLALWIPAKSNAPIIVFATLYGFGSGAFVSMAPALIAQISPDVTKIGVRTGSLFAIISIAALVGSPIGGAIVTAWGGSFTGLQIFCGCIQAGGAVFMLAARILLGGWSWKVKV